MMGWLYGHYNEYHARRQNILVPGFFFSIIISNYYRLKDVCSLIERQILPRNL